jgi:hypothetical protein
MDVEFILGRQTSDREDILIDRLKDVMGGDPLTSVLFVVHRRPHIQWIRC